jgi:formylglycine-generating enzyme required for sulfatase activity
MKHLLTPIIMVLVLSLGACANPATLEPDDTPASAITRLPTLVPTLEPTQAPTFTAILEASATAPIEPTKEPYSPGDTYMRPADQKLMVYVPTGEFEMGAMGRGDTGTLPIHTVYLDGFWIDQTEVTNAQYGLCVQAGICVPSRYADLSMYNADNQPVLAVTWYDADSYCAWAGGSLPSESQWEYAARGPEGRTYPWGEAEPDCETANYLECLGKPAEVGLYPSGASRVGALDLAGNVYEWVSDWHAKYPEGRQVNPQGPSEGDRKIIRGGSWTDLPQFIHAIQRIRYVPTDASETVGFRCVLSSVPGEEQ